MNPPCFDPTCECCTAWKALDDHNTEEICRLRALVQATRSDLAKAMLTSTT